MHNISLRRIQVLSRHLIYWRRARAIPPLHQRDTYIVSPNADLRELPTAAVAYAARFPSLPSLPKMLALLSGHPRAFSTLIPSKDHREAYLDILAWLMKGGWVTQLRVFAWVRVPRAIRLQVRATMAEERRQQRQQRQQQRQQRRSENSRNEATRRSGGTRSRRRRRSERERRESSGREIDGRSMEGRKGNESSLLFSQCALFLLLL